MPTPPSTWQPLQILITLLGLGALGAGTISLLFPTQSLQIYGLTPPPPLTPASKQRPRISHEPLSRSLSIRNLTLGVTILAMTGYWRKLTLTQADEHVVEAVRNCLGYVVVCGSVVPAVDAYGAWRDGDLEGGFRGRATALHLARLGVWVLAAGWCLLS